MSNNLVIKNDSFIQSIHNTIDCISLVDAKRPNDRCWFTSKQIQDWAGMNKDTLNRKLEKLISVGRIINNSETIDNAGKSMRLKFEPHQTFTDIMSITLYGANNIPHETKIYNLNVLNHLAMIQLDNEKLNTIANKFSDILSEVETTGSYNVIQLDRKTQLQLAIINSEPNSAKQLAAMAELEQLHANEKKALEYKNEQLEADNEILTQQRDKAIQTKQQISDSKTAKALGRVGGLVTANNRLKDELYLNRNYRTIGAIAQLNGISENSLNWRLLKSYCDEHGLEVMKIQGVRFKINVYPIESFRAIYPELRVD